MALPEIEIKPQAKHNGLFLTCMGLIFLAILLIISQFFWLQAKLPLIFLISASLVSLALGIAKLLEPPISFSITPEKISYYHKYGNWQLSWPEIANINIITSSHGLERLQLPYIGIRLHDLSTLANKISPRLANRLIHEQRILLVHSVQQQLLTIEQSQMNFEPFQLSDNSQIKGPIAAFLHQAERLQEALGYHLYLPANSADRTLDEFNQLLKQCRASAGNYQANDE